MVKIEVVKQFDEQTLKDILFILRDSFPLQWRYDDDYTYYKSMLNNKMNIHLFLIVDGRRVGYLHAIPHVDAADELKEDDPEMRPDSSMYYIEVVGIRSEYRGRKGFTLMLEALKHECRLRGISKISLHARVHTNFSEIIQHKLNVDTIRRVEKWKHYNFEEPTDYIEASFY